MPPRSRASRRTAHERGSAAVAVVLGLIALAFLIACAIALPRQARALADGVRQLQEQTPGGADPARCAQDPSPIAQLEQAARLGQGLHMGAWSLAWLDRSGTEAAVQAVARHVIRDRLVPAMACAMTQRAQGVLAALRQPVVAAQTGSAGFVSQRNAVLARLRAVRDWRETQTRLDALVAPGLPARERLARLDALSRAVLGTGLGADTLAAPAILRAAVESPEAGWQTASASVPAALVAQMDAQLQADIRGLSERLQRELAAGATLWPAGAGSATSPVAPGASAAAIVEWLNWIERDWLAPATADTACAQTARLLVDSVEPLVTRHGHARQLLDAVSRFEAASCHAPGLGQLGAMKIAPWGALLDSSGARATLAPAFREQARELEALRRLGFMNAQASVARDLAPCADSRTAWNPAAIARATTFAREFTAFAANRAQPAVKGADFPLRLARAQFDAVIAQALSPSRPRVPDDKPEEASVEALARSMSESLPTVLELLRLLGQNGLVALTASQTQCLREIAADALGRIQALGTRGALYEPAASASASGPVFPALSVEATLRDYLAAQLQRTQVLAGYATPFVNLLRQTDAASDARRGMAATATYWENTLRELKAHAAAKPSGQVLALERTLARAGAQDACQARADDADAPDLGADLFSQRRAAFGARLKLYCAERATGLAWDAYSALAARFNAELAGRYPFGGLETRDAAPVVVAEFLRDFAKIRATLETQASAFGPAQRQFLASLDLAASLLGPLLDNPARAVELELAWSTKPGDGSDQIITRSVSVGSRTQVFPPQQQARLPWAVSQPVEFDFTWAAQSVWRPQADPGQRDLSVADAHALISGEGPWALLRLIERHASGKLVAGSPITLRFDVPVARGAQGKGPARQRAALTAQMSLGMSASPNAASAPWPWTASLVRQAPAATPSLRD